MKETDIWRLVCKGLTGDANPLELQQLQEILNENPDLQQAFIYLKETRVSVGDKFLLTDEVIKQMEDKGLSQIEKMLSFDQPLEYKTVAISHNKKRRRWLAAASVIAVIGLAALFFLSVRQPLPAGYASQSKPATEIFVATKAISIELEDGTKVWLNKGSTLKCDKKFNKTNREVFLQGEGFFDVAQNASSPFVVHLKKGINIRVLGTRFNVKAYPNTPFIEASLLTGKIALDLNDSHQKNLILQPHEKITINTGRLKTGTDHHSTDTAVAVQKAELKPNPIDQQLSETAWMDNRLSFYDISFEELAYELERYYGKKFIFRDSHLKQWHLTGSFKDESLSQVLKALQITTPFQYKIEGEQVILFNHSKNKRL